MSNLEYVKRPIKNVFDITTIGITPTIIECACGHTWKENDGFSCADFIGKHANHNVKFARFPIAETILAGNINKMKSLVSWERTENDFEFQDEPRRVRAEKG